MTERADVEHVIRAITRGVPHLVAGGRPGERAGVERLACVKLGCEPTPGFELFSDAFEDGGEIPEEFTSEGAGRAPDLTWSGVPEAAQQLVLLVEDPDAPTAEPYVHWIVYGVPKSAPSIRRAIASGAREGRNSLLRPKWAAVGPPKGDSAHRYFFELFAVDGDLALGPHVGRAELLHALEGRIVGYAQCVGTFERD